MTGRPRTVDHDRVCALRAEGLPHWQIAEIIGCPQSTIRMIISRRGETSHKRSKNVDYDLARRLHQKGVPLAEIAARVGCSVGTLSHSKGPLKQGEVMYVPKPAERGPAPITLPRLNWIARP